MIWIKKIKREVSLFLCKKIRNERMIDIFRTVNNIIFHWELRKRVIQNRRGKKIMVVFPIGHGTDTTAGLMAIFLVVVPFVYWCQKKGYIPYIDGKNYKCQYSVKRKIHGSDNAWEYYFAQPAAESELNERNNYKVILDGWTLFRDRKRENDYLEFFALEEKLQRDFIKKYIPVQEYIWKIVEAKEKDLGISYYETLGVFLRGTDYVRIKPKGHSVQPSADEVIEKIREFDLKYSLRKIFMVTEDIKIFSIIKEEYGDRVICSDYNFVNYNESENLYLYEAFGDDPYERGLNYMIRLLILSKCAYLISSKASGSWYAITMGGHRDKYIYDLGFY